MDRWQKREGVDMTYLKNVILKLLETGIFMKGFYNNLILFLLHSNNHLMRCECTSGVGKSECFYYSNR